MMKASRLFLLLLLVGKTIRMTELDPLLVPYLLLACTVRRWTSKIGRSNL